MKVALAQINPIVGAFEYNAAKICTFAEKAKQQGADLVVFPELALVGYPPLDLLEKDQFARDNLRFLKKLCSQIKGMSALVGYIDINSDGHGKRYFNAAALLHDGKILSKHYKSLLPSYDVFDETRHFEPGPKCHSTTLGKEPLAVTICEDIWNDKDYWQRRLYKTDPLSVLLKTKKKCLINLAASPYSLGKYKKRLELLKAISCKYKTPTIFVNQVGGNDGIIFDGGSFALNKKGEIMAQCRDFQEDMVMVDLDTEQGNKNALSQSDVETAYRALILGIHDYVQKCGFKKVLIGLSGGIDSAVTAALAVDALGKDNVFGIMMPSRYSTKGSLVDARDLVTNLGIRSETISIELAFTAYLKSLKPLLEKGDPDITEQNLQARIRGNILMAYSNQWNALVLSTGNKSEMAAGYCTLYGDMSGGLSVLSDVPKTLVYKIAEFLNKKQRTIPKHCLTKPPSAELKHNQKDQDSLPPYDKLDRIISAYVEDHKSISELTKMGFSKILVEDVVTRIDRNEYKRRQAPPGLRITHKAFGIGRRLPIAQQYKEFAGTDETS